MATAKRGTSGVLFSLLVYTILLATGYVVLELPGVVGMGGNGCCLSLLR